MASCPCRSSRMKTSCCFLSVSELLQHSNFCLSYQINLYFFLAEEHLLLVPYKINKYIKRNDFYSKSVNALNPLVNRTALIKIIPVLGKSIPIFGWQWNGKVVFSLGLRIGPLTAVWMESSCQALSNFLYAIISTPILKMTVHLIYTKPTMYTNRWLQMKVYQLKMLVQECTNFFAYKLQVVQFWNSLFNWHSFIWSHRIPMKMHSLWYPQHLRVDRSYSAGKRFCWSAVATSTVVEGPPHYTQIST